MSDYVPMTRDGYNRLKAEIERLELVEMPKIAEKIADARAEGDLKENAEYHAQRENQGLMQAKINALKTKISKATSSMLPRFPKMKLCLERRFESRISISTMKKSTRSWGWVMKTTIAERS